MSEHEKQKYIELADGVGFAIEALVARAADAREVIWTAEAVAQLQTELDTEMSPAELAEALVREAAARGVAIAIEKPE